MVQSYTLVEDRHDTHHLRSAYRFGETPLIAPCQLGFGATFHLSHVSYEVR